MKEYEIMSRDSKNEEEEEEQKKKKRGGSCGGKSSSSPSSSDSASASSADGGGDGVQGSHTATTAREDGATMDGCRHRGHALRSRSFQPRTTASCLSRGTGAGMDVSSHGEHTAGGGAPLGEQQHGLCHGQHLAAAR